MSWFVTDLSQKTCLTCQHFRECPRRLKSVGRALLLEYDKTTGGCGLFNNFKMLFNHKGDQESFCHYTRWRELP